MKLLVVIVNYKTPQLAIDCLQSLDHEITTVPGTRVIVTDNASGDGSAEKIRAAIDAHRWTWASVMELPKNGGFAVSNVLNKLRGKPRTDPPWLWWDFVRYNFIRCHRP